MYLSHGFSKRYLFWCTFIKIFEKGTCFSVYLSEDFSKRGKRYPFFSIPFSRFYKKVPVLMYLSQAILPPFLAVLSAPLLFLKCLAAMLPPPLLFPLFVLALPLLALPLCLPRPVPIVICLPSHVACTPPYYHPLVSAMVGALASPPPLLVLFWACIPFLLPVINHLSLTCIAPPLTS